jgi:ketosteroid isomerase-like protein
MKSLITFILLLLATAPSFGQATAKNQKAKEALLKLDQRFTQAFTNADAKFISSLLADDYRMFSLQGYSSNKKEVLEQVPQSPEQGLKLKDTLTNARLFGNTGVVTGVWALTMDGEEVFARYTNVYTKEKTAWKLVNTHQTSVPAWRMRKPADSDMSVVTPLACQQEANLRSKTAQQLTLLRVKNNTAGPIRALWIDFEGKRDTRPNEIAPIAPGESLDITTYVTHPFLVLDANDQCLGIYQPLPTPGIVVLNKQ